MRKELEKKINTFITEYSKLISFTIQNNDRNDIFNTKLVDIITIFNQSYQSFIKEYKLLPPLHLAEMEKLYFYSSSDLSDSLIIDFYNVNNCVSIELQKKDENYNAYLSNMGERHYKKMRIKTDIIKKYLDLMQKYQKLIRTYFSFREYYLCKHYTFFNIRLNENILNNISQFYLYFGNENFTVELIFDLGDKISISSYNVKIMGINELEKHEEKEIITFLLNNIYINTNYLSNLYKKKESDFNFLYKNLSYKRK